MPGHSLRQSNSMMRRVIFTAGVFLIMAGFLLALFNVSVRYSRVANSPGTMDCFKTTCR
jgi:hypothetical protein